MIHQNIPYGITPHNIWLHQEYPGVEYRRPKIYEVQLVVSGRQGVIFNPSFIQAALAATSACNALFLSVQLSNVNQ